MNTSAVIGLAITTAFFRSDYRPSATPSEVDADAAWEDIAELAEGYLQWTELGFTKCNIDKFSIAEAIWGLDATELEEVLSEG